MKPKNSNQIIAMFLTFLVVLLPLDSSLVSAATINSVSGHGSQGIPGFRARTDVTIINVSATVPEDADVSSGQVKILEAPTRSFECTLVDNNTRLFNCIHEYPEVTLPPNYAALPFTVQVFNDAGNPISPSVRGSVMVDSEPPRVRKQTVYTTRDDGVVVAEFDVEDIACLAPACAGKCSGVSSVKFKVAELVVSQNSSFADVTGACHQSGRIELIGLAVGGEVATKRVCLEAIDLLGQTGTSCSDVVIDTKPPEVTGIGLFDAAGLPVRQTNGAPVGDLVLKVNITEHSKIIDPVSGDENFIMLDTSALSERPEHKLVFKERHAKCTKISGSETEYECSTPGLYLIVSSPGALPIQITAKDSHNNILNSSSSVSVNFDNVPPAATRIYSSFPDEKDNYWVAAENNTIFIDINEAGAGINNRRVVLDFTSFGAQLTSSGGMALVPNECSQGSSGWMCRWNRIQTDKADGITLSLSPKAGSFDDAGNALQPVSGSFRIDKTPPEVTPELEAISNISGIGETDSHPDSEELVGGELITIHLFVRDRSGLKKAVANFSDIVEGGEGAAEGVCTENQAIAGESMRIFECIWENGPIKDGYLGPDANNAPSIQFTFEDFTGHAGSYEWNDIEILAVENETLEARWEAEAVSYSPELGLDRLTWQLSQPRMYYQIELQPKTERKIEPISVKLDAESCTHLEYVNVNPLTNDVGISLLNFPVYENRPTDFPLKDIVEILFSPASVPEIETVDEEGNKKPFNGFLINCSMVVTSIVHTTEEGMERMLTLPEEVNISFYVPVYNNPLGQNIGNIQDRLDEMEDYNDDYEWLTILRQIFDVAQMVCDMISTYIQIDAAIAVVKDIFGGDCARGGTYSCDLSQEFGESLGEDDTIISDFIKEVYHFCGLFISCRPTDPDAGNPPRCGEENDDTWCNVQQTWYHITSWYSRYVVDNMNPEIRGAHLFDRNSFDPKRSMFSSALTLCIPGIINNLEKLRQIHCKKILCYKVDLANGRPVWRCDQEYSYLVCTHLVGQVFAAIPLAQFVSNVGDMLSGIFDNPWGLVGLVIDKGCNLICTSSWETGCYACRVINFIPAAVNIVADLIESTGPRWEAATFDMCEEALKDNPEYANIGGIGEYASTPTPSYDEEKVSYKTRGSKNNKEGSKGDKSPSGGDGGSKAPAAVPRAVEQNFVYQSSGDAEYSLRMNDKGTTFVDSGGKEVQLNTNNFLPRACNGCDYGVSTKEGKYYAVVDNQRIDITDAYLTEVRRVTGISINSGEYSANVKEGRARRQPAAEPAPATPAPAAGSAGVPAASPAEPAPEYYTDGETQFRVVGNEVQVRDVTNGQWRSADPTAVAEVRDSWTPTYPGATLIRNDVAYRRTDSGEWYVMTPGGRRGDNVDSNLARSLEQLAVQEGKAPASEQASTSTAPEESAPAPEAESSDIEPEAGSGSGGGTQRDGLQITVGEQTFEFPRNPDGSHNIPAALAERMPLNTVSGPFGVDVGEQARQRCRTGRCSLFVNSDGTATLTADNIPLTLSREELRSLLDGALPELTDGEFDDALADILENQEGTGETEGGAEAVEAGSGGRPSRERPQSEFSKRLAEDAERQGGWVNYFLKEGENQRLARSISRWAGYDEDTPACPGCVAWLNNLFGYEAWADSLCRSYFKSEEGSTFLVSRSGYTSVDIEGEKKEIFPCGKDNTEPDYALPNGSTINCNKFYRYKITGSVVPGEVALEFDVYLNKADSSKSLEKEKDLLLYADKNGEPVKVKLNRSGTPWMLSGPTIFVYDSYNNYESACLSFTVPSVDLLMTVIPVMTVKKNDLNPFCNPIKDAYVSQSVKEEEYSVSHSSSSVTVSEGSVGVSEDGESSGIVSPGGCVGPTC